MRTVFTLLVVIVLGAGGVVYYKTQLAVDPPNNFRTVTVKRGDLVSTISATGTVQAEEFVDVGAQVAGKIVDFGIDPADLKDRDPTDIKPEEKKKLRRVDYNTVVHEGTVLAYIDPTLYKAQLAQADATLERNKADLVQLKAKREQAAADWARAKRLRPDRVASDKDDPDKEDVTAENTAAAENKASAGKAAAEKKAAAETKSVPDGKAAETMAAAEGNKGLLDYRAMSDTDYDLAKANYRGGQGERGRRGEDHRADQGGPGHGQDQPGLLHDQLARRGRDHRSPRQHRPDRGRQPQRPQPVPASPRT